MKYYRQIRHTWPRKWTIEDTIYSGLWAMIGTLLAMVLLRIFGG
jgi:hypothetical protein